MHFGCGILIKEKLSQPPTVSIGRPVEPGGPLLHVEAESAMPFTPEAVLGVLGGIPEHAFNTELVLGTGPWPFGQKDRPEDEPKALEAIRQGSLLQHQPVMYYFCFRSEDELKVREVHPLR